MRSNYKKLGKYIQQVDVRNTDLNVETLLGVSIKKVLMPSIANTVGTNMKTYKIIKRNQFAYGPVTSRNGDKISVALLEDYEEAIVSQAYTVFEVKDKNELHPEYLMMWMRRPEFDRYARFKSHGSAREVFDWGEMCDTALPIPSIDKQREIVAEYNTIKNHIALNEQLIQKLEETAQAIYKQWFVDFEFPDENGNPYKSFGGKMIWNEELEKEIPEGWEVGNLREIASIKHGYAFQGEDFSETETDLILVSPGNFKITGGFNFNKNKYYKGIIPKIYILTENELVINMTDLSKNGDTLGNTALIPNVNFKTFLHNQRVGKFEFQRDEFLYYVSMLTNYSSFKNYILGTATGTTVRHTSPTRIEEFFLIKPNRNILLNFNKLIKPTMDNVNNSFSQDYYLKELLSLLLSKIATTEN